MKRPVYKVVTRNRKSIAARGKYSRTYQQGTIVEADERTLGLMCFKTKRDALQFIYDHNLFLNCQAKIIKVRGFGRCKKIKNVVFLSLRRKSDRFNEHNLNTYYNDPNAIYKFGPPSGTISFPAVEVID